MGNISLIGEDPGLSAIPCPAGSETHPAGADSGWLAKPVARSSKGKGKWSDGSLVRHFSGRLDSPRQCAGATSMVFGDGPWGQMS